MCIQFLGPGGALAEKYNNWQKCHQPVLLATLVCFWIDPELFRPWRNGLLSFVSSTFFAWTTWTWRHSKAGVRLSSRSFTSRLLQCCSRGSSCLDTGTTANCKESCVRQQEWCSTSNHVITWLGLVLCVAKIPILTIRASVNRDFVVPPFIGDRVFFCRCTGCVEQTSNRT